MKTAVSVGSVVAATLIAAPALAQAPQDVSVRTEASAREVAAGDSFVVQVTALSGAGTPSPANPQLKIPAGVTAHGPTLSTRQQVSIVNGRIEQRQGVSATWSLVASKPGRYRIGPGSFSVGSARVAGETITIEVVPPGLGRPSPRSGWPHDPFGGGFPRLPGFPNLPNFPDLFNDNDDPSLDTLPPVPEEFKIDSVRDPLAFLNATVDKRRVVVGEQLTFRVIAYGGRGPFMENNPSEPPRGDFVGYPIVESSQGERPHLLAIGDDVWHAIKVREFALLPIRSGTLTIGSMKMSFEGRGYPSGGRRQGLVRTSQPVSVVVTEPPIQGRPAGYKIGDVGQFRLSASVDPREVTVGDATSVVVKLEGTGNLPYKLRTPGQHGTEWLEPTLTEKIDVNNGIVGGYRTFTYVVRVSRSGALDLGEISLPYWDPALSRYEVARASLGTLQVQDRPGAAAPAVQTSKPDPLSALIKPRKQLGAPPAPITYPTDQRWFWGLLLLAPLAVVLTGLGVRGGVALRRRLQARQQAHGTRIAGALNEARAALANDQAAAVGHAERAVFSAIEAKTGVKARAVLRTELESVLVAHGIHDELAAETRAYLDECDALRFTGVSEGASPGELVSRAETLVKRVRAGGK